jgi:hypothetical protein
MTSVLRLLDVGCGRQCVCGSARCRTRSHKKPRELDLSELLGAGGSCETDAAGDAEADDDCGGLAAVYEVLCFSGDVVSVLGRTDESCQGVMRRVPGALDIVVMTPIGGGHMTNVSWVFRHGAWHHAPRRHSISGETEGG